MNLKVAKLSDVQDVPAREADLYDKTRWTSLEIMKLTSRFRDAATKLESAHTARSFDGIRQAYTEIQTIRDQTSHMLEGLGRAIEKEQERRQ